MEHEVYQRGKICGNKSYFLANQEKFGHWTGKMNDYVRSKLCVEDNAILQEIRLVMKSKAGFIQLCYWECTKWLYLKC